MSQPLVYVNKQRGHDISLFQCSKSEPPKFPNAVATPVLAQRFFSDGSPVLRPGISAEAWALACEKRAIIGGL